MRKLICLAAALGIASLAAPASAAPIIANAGFETPNVGTGGGAYRYGDGFGPGSPITIAEQGGAGWTFNGGAGIAANGSAFNVVGADGNQAGFIQGTGSFSQSVSGFGAGIYALGFFAEGRGTQDGPNDFTVTIDGVPLAFSGVSDITPPFTNQFTSFTSDPFLLTAGTHVLAFKGLDTLGGDRTSFVDDVSFPIFTPVPEPASVVLFGMGVLGVTGYCWRRRGRAAPILPARYLSLP